MRTIGRFAPSPTGPLHFGSLVAAVASWLDARAAGGEWHLRIEDVDTTRTVPGAEDAILRQLEAFGLAWDGPIVRQRERTDRYRDALGQLDRAGLAFACRCSRKEIADSAVQGVDGAIYPGTCRGANIPAGEPVAVRFRAPGGATVIHDRLQGDITQNLALDVGDFVVRRRDGLFAYQLAVVVDDADLGVTGVVRGADLLDSTPRQVALQRALGFATPSYLHVPVATRKGEKLSKQTLAPAVSTDQSSSAIRAALAFLGQDIVDTSAATTSAELLFMAKKRWDPGRIPRARSLELRDQWSQARAAPPGKTP